MRVSEWLCCDDDMTPEDPIIPQIRRAVREELFSHEFKTGLNRVVRENAREVVRAEVREALAEAVGGILAEVRRAK